MRIPAAVAWLVAGVLGCGNDPADLYRNHGGGEGDAGPSADAGLDPYEAALRIYGDEPDCVACIADECETEARACADDPACAEDARCRAECGGDYACLLWQCANLHPLDERPTTPLEDGCVQTKCIEACRVGQSFDCVGDYAWPRPEAEAPVLSVQLTAGVEQVRLMEAGLRARVCPWGFLDCAEPAGDALSNEAGIVEIAFPAPVSAALQLQTFRGYVELTDPGRSSPRTRPVLYVPLAPFGYPQAPPESNKHPWVLPTWPEELVGIEKALYGVEQQPGRGLVTAVMFDCRVSQSWRATGATLEVVQADPETRMSYGYGPSNTETERTGSAFAWNVPPGIVTLRALHRGTPFSTVDVPVRADTSTIVYLFPDPSR